MNPCLERPSWYLLTIIRVLRRDWRLTNDLSGSREYPTHRISLAEDHSLKDSNTKLTALFIYQLHGLIHAAIMDSKKYVQCLSQVSMTLR